MHLPLVRTIDILWIFVCRVVRCFTVAPAGLCERHRVISQHNNNCGSGCEGLCMCEIHCERNFVSMRNFVVSCRDWFVGTKKDSAWNAEAQSWTRRYVLSLAKKSRQTGFSLRICGMWKYDCSEWEADIVSKRLQLEPNVSILHCRILLYFPLRASKWYLPMYSTGIFELFFSL